MSFEKLPFMQHLAELRKRLMVSVAVAFIGFLVSFAYSEDIFRALLFPMNAVITFGSAFPFISYVPSAEPHSLIFLAPAEAFWAHMKIAMITGLVAAFPVIAYEIWRFVSPGLIEKEKKFAVPFIVIVSGLFVFGAMFCFFIILPFAMNFLLTYKTESLTPMISVGKYIDFCLKFILAFGAVFELPVVIVFLTRSGIVSIQTLSKNRKYAVLFAFILAAVLTPTPDAFNQILMAVPIIILYEGGILASRVFVRRKHGTNTG